MTVCWQKESSVCVYVLRWLCCETQRRVEMTQGGVIHTRYAQTATQEEFVVKSRCSRMFLI